MDLSKGQIEGLKKYLMKISDDLIIDADVFVNYNSAFPEFVVMVDVDWDKLPKEFAYNYNMYLKDIYGKNVKTFLTMMGIPFNGRVIFDIMNWGDED